MRVYSFTFTIQAKNPIAQDTIITVICGSYKEALASLTADERSRILSVERG